MYSQLLISDFCHQIFSKSSILFSHSAGDWTRNLLRATLALSCIAKKENIWVTDAVEYQWTNRNDNLQRRKRGSISEGTNAPFILSTSCFGLNAWGIFPGLQPTAPQGIVSTAPLHTECKDSSIACCLELSVGFSHYPHSRTSSPEAVAMGL